jgi:hypothetical protein
VKQRFALHKLFANPVNLKVLIDGVQVEKEDQSHQPPDGVREYILREEILMDQCLGEKKRSQPKRENQSNYERGSPQPPFPPLDQMEVRASQLGLASSRRSPLILDFTVSQASLVDGNSSEKSASRFRGSFDVLGGSPFLLIATCTKSAISPFRLSRDSFSRC